MRSVPMILIALGLNISAHAYPIKPSCNFKYYGSSQNISNLDGYKVLAIPAQFQNIQIYGQTRAQYRTERRPAWDGGPMEYVKTEVRPASNSQTQRKLVRPAYFVIKDTENRQIGQFDNRADVQAYVCQVLIPTFGKSRNSSSVSEVTSK